MQIASASIFIVAGIMLLAETLQDPGSLTYPLAYPQVLLAVLLVLFAALLVTTGLARSAARTAETGSSEGSTEAGRPPVRPLVGLACCIGYVYAWTSVGYIPATVLFLALMLVVGGERDMRLIGAVSLSVAILILVVFVELLRIPLPRVPWDLFS